MNLYPVLGSPHVCSVWTLRLCHTSPTYPDPRIFSSTVGNLWGCLPPADVPRPKCCLTRWTRRFGTFEATTAPRSRHCSRACRSSEKLVEFPVQQPRKLHMITSLLLDTFPYIRCNPWYRSLHLMPKTPGQKCIHGAADKLSLNIIPDSFHLCLPAQRRLRTVSTLALLGHKFSFANPSCSFLR